MCRSIKTLRRPNEQATDEELHAAALQFVRKISGYRKPSRANEQAFNHAAEYALSQPGVRDVVLIGESMGGGIVLKFLYESPLASYVSGTVLDSPVTDFNALVDPGARERNLPGFVAVETSDRLADLRPDIVSYSVYSDASHASGWNVDSARYERELRAFLLRVVR